jgi:hypothetical protein
MLKKFLQSIGAHLLLNSIAGVITAEVSNLISKFSDKHGADATKALVKNLSDSLNSLAEAAKETDTNIDDTIVSMLLKALPQETAATETFSEAPEVVPEIEAQPKKKGKK